MFPFLLKRWTKGGSAVIVLLLPPACRHLDRPDHGLTLWADSIRLCGNKQLTKVVVAHKALRLESIHLQGVLRFELRASQQSRSLAQRAERQHEWPSFARRRTRAAATAAEP